MRVFRTLNFQMDTPCSVALGCFDGVHLGHRAVIECARREAVEKKLLCAVFTFEAPPKGFFAPDGVQMLSSVEDKLEIFSRLGVDICVCLPLSEDIFNTDALSFAEDIILGKMRAAHIVCGYNYTFGKRGAGNARFLKDICSKNGIGISVIPEQRVDKTTVSSTEIRAMLASGDMENAQRLLGRAYSVSAEVIDGQHLARSLGFPTVNIIPPKGVMLPRRGVYISKIKFSGTQKYGITNVGLRPTVGTDIECAETHIFDFEGNLYGQRISVELLHFLREEKKFSSVEEMAKQIHEDIDRVKLLLSQK